MTEETGNIWDYLEKVDAICITTNGFVTKSWPNRAVMGRGTARQAAERYKGLEVYLGTLIEANGNIVQVCGDVSSNTKLVSFPVKPVSILSFNPKKHQVVHHVKKVYREGDTVPGFHAVADCRIIEKSAKELVLLADCANWKKIVLPRPGCGAGELTWAQVQPILKPILDDRFIIASL